MFNWDVVEHEAKHEPWEFKSGGKKWRLPHPQDLTVGQQRVADAGMLEIVVREVGELWNKKTGEWEPAGDKLALLVSQKHPDQLGALRAAWLAHAGVEPGESRASSR